MIENKDSIFKISLSDFLKDKDLESVFTVLENEQCVDVKKVLKISDVQNIRVKRFMDLLNHHAKGICENQYAKQLGVEFIKTTWIREPELVKWEPGSSLAPHIDGSGRIEPPQLTVGGLLYLNDNYSGGELYFPDYDVLIKPKAGDLVFFPCHFYHEVKAIHNEDEHIHRYTLPLFYTFICKEVE